MIQRILLTVFFISILSFVNSVEIYAQLSSNDPLSQYISSELDRELVRDFQNKTDQSFFVSESNMNSIKLPKVFNFESLGFFCKIEHRAMQKGNFPMRFRLGEFRKTLNYEAGEMW